MNGNHAWKFFRAGGFEQVKLDSGADLLALDHLDQKLWVALACPTTGLELDSHTLALIDSDKDGRIRAPDILAAVKWATGLLKNADQLIPGSAELPLNAINDSTPAGRQLLASAQQILANLGKPDSPTIGPSDTSDTKKIFGNTKFNGDGIITAESASDDATKTAIADIILCVGADLDRNGKPGINQARLDQFFAQAKAFTDWQAKGESDPSILPLGADTAEGAAALEKMRAKIEDYFARSRFAAFDPRSLTALNREEKEYVTMGGRDLSASAEEMAAFPLATVAPGKPLPLHEGLNPAWEAAVSRFNSSVAKKMTNGRDSLTETDWSAIKAQFAPYEAWLAAKPANTVEKLGIGRIRELLAGKARETLEGLILQDKDLEDEADGIAGVDKLVHFHRDLYKLLNNFVSFRDFYGRKDKAIFQAGTLFLDQRSCDLCLPVEDSSKHATMAGLAGAYLAYCDCTRKATGQKMQIVAAFMGGDSDNLMVGRNGVFYDRKGLDWDASITKIVDNPISIRQAFWAPYKKLVRMIEEQVAKRAAAADSASTDKLSAAATQVAEGGQLGAQTGTKPAGPRKLDIGVVAALGVAVGAIGGALASLSSGLMRLPVWQIPLVFITLILLVSIPSMLIAWLKLKKRNLGPILDANGWAVNAKAKINIPFGGSLTKVAKLPPGSDTDWVDPYAEKRSPWPRLLLIALLAWIAYIALNHMGYIHEWSHGRLGKPKIAAAEAPVKITTVVAPAPATETAPAAEAPK